MFGKSNRHMCKQKLVMLFFMYISNTKYLSVDNIVHWHISCVYLHSKLLSDWVSLSNNFSSNLLWSQKLRLCFLQE